MPRQPRRFALDIAHHIIARGNNRQWLFRKDADFARYQMFLSFLKSEYAFSIYHYCLMSNHVHLLVRFATEEAFRKVPQRLSLLYAKYFAREYGHVGHVFQDRFKSIPVEDNGYLLECGRYIERNPVKAGLVKQAGDYRWSSHGYYVAGAANPLVTINPLFQGLAGTDVERQQIYRSFVDRERPYETVIEKALFGRNQRQKAST